MSIFRNIDSQIIELSNRLNAKISIDRPGYPESMRTFEERRIDWIDNDIRKAIIIQPNFEIKGVNSELWNFKLVAWNTGNGRTRKNTWVKDLIKEEMFSKIEGSIKDLLATALETLKEIDKYNLVPMNGVYLFLDLDGVLITTPSWQSDKIDKDGYSQFNSKCIFKLNELLNTKKFQIWLSSSRRKGKTLEEFNKIFSNRKIDCEIYSFLPIYDDCVNRKDEILKFITERNIVNFIILDDDKSLNSLEQEHKKNLILTDNMIGFTDKELRKALQIIEKRK